MKYNYILLGAVLLQCSTHAGEIGAIAERGAEAAAKDTGFLARTEQWSKDLSSAVDSRYKTIYNDLRPENEMIKPFVMDTRALLRASRDTIVNLWQEARQQAQNAWNKVIQLSNMLQDAGSKAALGVQDAGSRRANNWLQGELDKARVEFATLRARVRMYENELKRRDMLARRGQTRGTGLGAQVLDASDQVQRGGSSVVNAIQSRYALPLPDEVGAGQ